MNLAASYICEFHTTSLNSVLPYIDFLFSNDEEALAYSKFNNFETTNFEEIAKKLSNFEKVFIYFFFFFMRINFFIVNLIQVNKKIERTVIITQGSNEIIVAVGNSNIQKFNVPKVDNIVDTNGAGDAFCGGSLFLFLFIKFVYFFYRFFSRINSQ